VCGCSCVCRLAFVLAVGWTMHTSYFCMCAVCFVVFTYLDVKDYSVLLKMLNIKL